MGAHYLLTHFDTPIIDPNEHRLHFEGAFKNPFHLDMEHIRSLPSVTMPVTLECSGNGRTKISPRRYSMPWAYEAVGTSEWTGTPLAPLIERADPIQKLLKSRLPVLTTVMMPVLAIISGGV